MSTSVGSYRTETLSGFRDKRPPSDVQFAARRTNALRIADKIRSKLDQGCRVFDDLGDEVLDVSYRDNGDIVYRHREGGQIIQFLNDKTWDNGAMDSVADYTASFEGWSFVHPRDIRPLKV